MYRLAPTKVESLVTFEGLTESGVTYRGKFRGTGGTGGVWTLKILGSS